MQRCPECRRDYYDDSLLYCLDDGARLLEGPGTEEKTMILPDRSAALGSVPVFHFSLPTLSQVTFSEAIEQYPAWSPSGEELGFSRVETVISSGNVVFESDRDDQGNIESELEKGWVSRLGFQSATIVRSREQLARLVDADPLAGLEHGPETYLLVTFCKEPPEVEWDLPYQPPGKPYRLEALVDGTIFSVTSVRESRLASG